MYQNPYWRLSLLTTAFCLLVAVATAATPAPPQLTISQTGHDYGTVLGARSATLTVSANPGGAMTVALSGTGATPPHLVISPPTFNFGYIQVGKSVTADIWVENTGQTDSGPLSIAFTGADAGAFRSVSYSSTFTASYLAGGAPGMSTLAVTGTSV